MLRNIIGKYNRTYIIVFFHISCDCDIFLIYGNTLRDFSINPLIVMFYAFMFCIEIKKN